MPPEKHIFSQKKKLEYTHIPWDLTFWDHMNRFFTTINEELSNCIDILYNHNGILQVNLQTGGIIKS